MTTSLHTGIAASIDALMDLHPDAVRDAPVPFVPEQDPARRARFAFVGAIVSIAVLSPSTFALLPDAT